MSFLGKPRPKAQKKDLPLLALKDMVVFPKTVTPFFASLGNALKALEIAMSEDQEVFLVPQKTPKDDPSQEDLHDLGTVAQILQTLKLPDGTIRVLVEGKMRAKLQKFNSKKDYIRAEVLPLEEPLEVKGDTLALMQMVQNTLKEYKDLQNKIPKDKLQPIVQSQTPDELVDRVVPHLSITEPKKLEFFLETVPEARLENLAVTLEMEKELNQIQQDIHKRVKGRLEQNQKEYYLNEQLKEIHKELGHDDGDPTGAIELKGRIQNLGLPKDLEEKALKECQRLSKLQATTPESGILRHYLEWICDLPWSKSSEDLMDLKAAQEILDTDHFDMEKAKEKILDFLAVHQIKEGLKGPILCLVGPPGTGKTSLGRSIARALGRSFVRISLGGVRDEAEIRGHRRTYIGALPGKIIAGMKKAGTNNPVFLLDEIDKLSSDFRGDPAAALLEVLDPEQNSTFVDHYLEVPFDLSKVLFLTTANSLHNLPRPLLDRMDVVEIPGYTDREKLKIAQGFIIPKQLKENGLEGPQITFSEGAILEIIHNYTMESGVRSLERCISQVMRKLARRLLKDGFTPDQVRSGEISEEQISNLDTSYKYDPELKALHIEIEPEQVKKDLGLPRLKEDKLLATQKPGIANGLAWTEVGGKVLTVEVNLFKGKGDLLLTGSLGDVMKESARIALSFLKSKGGIWGLKDQDFQERDIHIHFPEGAIPKDGPSAGITVVSALLSAIKQQPLRAGVAMTGEVTLTGRIVAIGGVKEKVLAAFRHGIRDVFLPEDNRRNLEEIPQEIAQQMNFHFSGNIEDALPFLFPQEALKPSKNIKSNSKEEL